MEAKGSFQSSLFCILSASFLAQVKMMSSLTGEGLDKVWSSMCEYREVMAEEGRLEHRRAEQRKKWMWNYINYRLLEVCFQCKTCETK